MSYRINLSHGLADNPDAAAIREEVFIQEQGFIGEFDDIDARATHVVLYDGEDAVATGRLFFDETPRRQTIGRVAVRRAWRGRFLGREVLRVLEAEAQRTGAQVITLSAQVQAQGFYEKLGYTAVSGQYLDESCPHVRMEKRLLPDEAAQ